MPTLTVGLRITVDPVLHMSRPSRVPTSRRPPADSERMGSKFDIGWTLDQLFHALRCKIAEFGRDVGAPAPGSRQSLISAR